MRLNLNRVLGMAVPAALLGAAVLLGAAAPAGAQDMEPRTFSNAPVGMNFLVLGYAYTRGGAWFDPAVPVSNPDLKTSNMVFAYARAMDFFGKSGMVQVAVPYTFLSGTALLNDEPAQRNVSGFANTTFKLSVNLYGAPALALKDFAQWQQDLIVGASLRVQAPFSQYDPSKIVNIGTNRWSFKPEAGFSKAVGPWIFEGTAAGTFFTDNSDFYGGQMRTQDPVYSAEAHVIRSFARGIWASVDTTYYTGGRSVIGGVPKTDLQQNWRVGATLALPVDRNNSIKLYASKGVADRTGNSFDLIGIVWQYRWVEGF